MFNYSEIRNYGKPYIIAEIGANHNGNIELAKKMIEVAKNCGADCVKFQSWSKETIFSRKIYEDNYFLCDDYRNRKDYTLEETVDKYSIGKKEHIELKKYCDSIGIDFASTPFSKGEVDMLCDTLKVPFLKVASMDLNNIPFLQYMAKKQKPIVISTGLSDLTDINEAIKCIEKCRNLEIILLHCISIYPPKDDEVNLNNMDMLRDNFSYPVGYSDHTIGTVASILSIAKGACIIEKHFTLDKNMIGWDHKVSANPTELKIIVDACGCAYKMLGSYRRVVSENEERRNAFKRSIVASCDIKKGTIITENDIDYKRPGTGITPKYYQFLIGKVAKNDIQKDALIKLEDF